MEAALAAAQAERAQQRAPLIKERQQRELIEACMAERKRYLQTFEAIAAHMPHAAPAKRRWWQRSKDTPTG